MSDKPWQILNDRLALRVRLTPKAGRDSIDGIEETPAGPALKIRVRAIPEDGKANAALEELVAKSLRIPKSAVSVVAGQKSRIKTLAISGNAGDLATLLAKQFASTA